MESNAIENNAMTNKGFHSYIRTLYGNFCDLEIISHSDTNNETVAIHARTNVLETPDDYRIEIALPGYKKSDITIKVEDDVLTVVVDCKTKEADKITRYYKKEFFVSSFTRSFLLPENVQDDLIEAVYADGVLMLTLPKGDTSITCKKDILIS